MRQLDQAHVPYRVNFYDCETFIDGVHIADMLGQSYDSSFKTLVSVGKTGKFYVFVIPIDEELDLKKCARSVGVKSVAMIHQKELFPLTGYVRGGCTAIGLKKNFVTRLDAHAKEQDRIYISGGKVGCQILLSPDDFIKTAWKAEYADLIRESRPSGP